MPRVQRKVATDEKRAQRGPVSGEAPRRRGRPPGRHRASRARALEAIFETAVDLGEGFRHGVLGAPRMGKTYHAQDVVTEAVAREIASWAFVHDTKRAEPQYEGTIRESVASLAGAPVAEGDSPVVVFHQSAVYRPSVEEVAELGLRFGRAGESTVVVVDELYKALKSRMTWAEPSFAEILREGSSQRVSAVWTTQIPQTLPTEALDLSETVAIFNLSGRSLSYVIDVFRLPSEVADLIPRLQRGEFILIHALHEWDGTIYGPM